jgi:hypothetical protein
VLEPSSGHALRSRTGPNRRFWSRTGTSEPTIAGFPATVAIGFLSGAFGATGKIFSLFFIFFLHLKIFLL